MLPLGNTCLVPLQDLRVGTRLPTPVTLPAKRVESLDLRGRKAPLDRLLYFEGVVGIEELCQLAHHLRLPRSPASIVVSFPAKVVHLGDQLDFLALEEGSKYQPKGCSRVSHATSKRMFSSLDGFLGNLECKVGQKVGPSTPNGLY